MTTYHCFNCGRDPIYLSEVSDPESPDFDKECCPYCKSTQVATYEESDD